jgi:bisanhydrobacterioruberin hydratase
MLKNIFSYLNIANEKPKVIYATTIAILFHTIGLVGILFFDKNLFVQLTPLNLLLSFFLLIYTHENKNKFFYFFMVITTITGIVVEIIGVNTGLLFGNYQYGVVLGPQIKNVPYIIGINWFIVIFSVGITVHTILNSAVKFVAEKTAEPPKAFKVISLIVDGATLAVFFDWVIEPVAIKLGFWHWLNDGEIPLYNYASWYIISLLLLVVFHFCKFEKQNKFAVNLLIIQLIFFLLLRTFLK